MTTLPEEAVKAAIAAHNKYYDDLVIYPSEEPTPEGAFHAALKGALPFLPVQGAVKKLKWNEYNDEQGIPDRWDAEASSFGVFYSIEIQHDGYRVVFDHEAVGAVGVFDTLEAAKAAAQADYEARILSALEPSADACQCTTIQQDETCPVGYPSLLCEICDGKGVVQPSAARELALEEAARVVKRRINLVPSNTKAFRAYQEACRHILSDLRTLSSPDHADAGKVEGDGCPSVKGVIPTKFGESICFCGIDGARLILVSVCGNSGLVPIKYLLPHQLYVHDVQKLSEQGEVLVCAVPVYDQQINVTSALPSAPSQEVAGS